MRARFANAALFIGVNLGTLFFPFPDVVLTSTKAGHWEVILIYGLAGMLILRVYLAGLRKFPGLDLVDIVSLIGKWWARVLLLPFLMFLFVTEIFLIRGDSEMVSIVFFKQTPLWALYAMLLGLSWYLASKGLEVIMQVAIVFLFVFFPLIAFCVCVSPKQFDWHFFYPAFDSSFHFLKSRQFYMGFFAVTPLLYLGMANHIEGGITAKGNRYMLVAGIVTLLFLVSVYIPLLTYGQEAASQLEFALLTALDAVELEWFVFDRITVLYIVASVAFLILYSALWIWMASRIITRLYVPVSHSYVVPSVTVLIYFICTKVPEWDWLMKVIELDTPLRAYVLLVVPLLVFLIGWKKGGRVHVQDEQAA